MTERYFVETPISGPTATLATAEAHHLAHVMRAKPGARVVIFDGRGGEYNAEVTRVDRATVQVAVLSHQAIERELPLPLVVAVALPKGERQRWLIEKLTELGCTAVVPLVTARGVAQPTAGAIDRLRRAVVEASKQCGRNRLMLIEAACEASEFLATAAGGACRLIAQPGASAAASDVLRQHGALSNPTGNAGIVAAVGPEGGFNDDELRLAASTEWKGVDLGSRILRVETAAVVLAATIGEALPSKRD